MAGRVTGCERGRRRGRQLVVAASVPRLEQALAPLEFDRLLNSLASLRGCVAARFFALLRCAISFVPCAVGAVMARGVGTWACTTPPARWRVRAARAVGRCPPEAHAAQRGGALLGGVVACRKT